jgi:Tfp pilus assembly protein PilV
MEGKTMNIYKFRPCAPFFDLSFDSGCGKGRGSSQYGKQQGFTLLEALIAFVILAGGLLALFRYHNTTMETTGEAKVRAEAMALGDQKLEELRSYLSQDNFQDDTVTGAGLGEYNGVDYAADFTRSWTVAGTNPREIAVAVSWDDRTGTTQSVQLSSLVWGVSPTQAASDLAAMIIGDAGVPPWPEADPLDDGTGHGTGRVTITLVDDDGIEYAPDDDLTGITILSYNISFTGYIDATNALLASVVLTGDAGTTGTPSCSGAVGDPTATAVLDIADGVTAYGDPPVVHPIDTLLDANGDPTPMGEDPYRYSCTINGITHNEVWTGTIVYEGVGNDEVCIPNTGTAELTFSEQSPAIVQLGIVILTNNGACNVL